MKEYLFDVDDLSAVVGVHVDGSSAVVCKLNSSWC